MFYTFIETFVGICNDFVSSQGFIYKVIRESFIFGLTAGLLAFIISPLKFLMIQKQQSGLPYIVILKERIKQYGLFVLYNGAVPYVIINFLINGSYGLSEVLSSEIICKFGLGLGFIGFTIKVLMAAVCETVATIHNEASEIKQNKIGFNVGRATVSSIILPAFIRNSLAWIPTVTIIYLAQILETKYGIVMSFFHIIFLSLSLGVMFGFDSLHFDIVVTKNLGAEKKLNLKERLKDIIKEDGGIANLFRSIIMRIVIGTLFTLCAVYTDKLIN